MIRPGIYPLLFTIFLSSAGAHCANNALDKKKLSNKQQSTTGFIFYTQSDVTHVHLASHFGLDLSNPWIYANIVTDRSIVDPFSHIVLEIKTSSAIAELAALARIEKQT